MDGALKECLDLVNDAAELGETNSSRGCDMDRREGKLERRARAEASKEVYGGEE